MKADELLKALMESTGSTEETMQAIYDEMSSRALLEAIGEFELKEMDEVAALESALHNAVAAFLGSEENRWGMTLAQLAAAFISFFATAIETVLLNAEHDGAKLSLGGILLVVRHRIEFAEELKKAADEGTLSSGDGALS